MLSIALWLLFYGVESFHYYGGDVGPKSTQFKVTLENGDNTYIPHVYGIDAPDEDNQKHVNNWVEFEQASGDSTKVTVERLAGAFPSNVEIRPVSYGIKLETANNGKNVSFTIKGTAKHISVHYGSDTDNTDKESAIYSSMLIFVTPPNIDQMYLENQINRTEANTMTFQSGKEYKLTDGNYKAGTGVYSVNNSVNSNINTIIIERGAYVYGKIDVNQDGVNIYGPGIIDGSYFDYDQRKTGPVKEQKKEHSITLYIHHVH